MRQAPGCPRAVICAALALIRLGLAWRARRVDDQIVCWRAVAGEGLAAEGDRPRLR